MHKHLKVCPCVLQLRFIFTEIQKRYLRHKNYRRVVANMDAQFPEATAEELAQHGEKNLRNVPNHLKAYAWFSGTSLQYIVNLWPSGHQSLQLKATSGVLSGVNGCHCGNILTKLHGLPSI